MIIFDPPQTIAEKSMEQAVLLHEIVEDEYPEYAIKAREVIIDYLRKHDPHRLKIFLGESTDGSENTPWFSIERIKLSTIQTNICQLLKAVEEGRVATPILLDALIRKHLGLPFKVIEER